MSGNAKIFTILEKKRGGTVSYGDNGKGKIKGIGKVGKSLSIDSVYFVQGLKHNLISVSQLCDNNYHVLFTESKCLLLDKSLHNIIYEGKRVGN